MTTRLTRAAQLIRTWMQGIGPAPIAALAGLCAIVYGVHRIYAPAAWIVGGVVLLLGAILFDRGQRRREIIERMKEGQ